MRSCSSTATRQNARSGKSPAAKSKPPSSHATQPFREVREELGIEVSITQEVGNCTFQEDDNTLHYIWFDASIVAGTPRITEPHLHDELQYFTLKGLRKIKNDLSPNTKAYLETC